MLIFRDFTPDNEARYLTIADEALSNGHFFSLTLNGQPYADKPPFYFWLIMICRKLFGHHAMFALSIFSFIPAVGVANFMNDWTRGSLSVPYRDLATLMLFTTAYFTGAAAVVRMDMLMCLFIMLAFRSFWILYTSDHIVRSEQWLMGVWLFFAMFTKGPLGFLIPLLTIIIFLLITHSRRKVGQMLNWRSWLVFVVSCVGWFAMTYHESGGDYLYNMVIHQTFGRSINSFHHAHPFYYYLITIWYEWQPWTFLCVGSIIWALIRKQLLGDVYSFFLCMVLTTLVLLSCISSKLEIYLLPAFPFVIYLTAYIIETHKGCRWISLALSIPEIVLMLAFPTLLVLQHVIYHPLLHLPLVATLTAVLSILGAVSMYQLSVKKSLIVSIQILGYGVLGILFVAGCAMPIINQNIV